MADAPIAPRLSVVAPMHNEAGNAARLAGEIYAVLREIDHEIVCVNDASTDSTLSELQAARACLLYTSPSPRD